MYCSWIKLKYGSFKNDWNSSIYKYGDFGWKMCTPLVLFDIYFMNSLLANELMSRDIVYIFLYVDYLLNFVLVGVMSQLECESDVVEQQE